MVSITDGERGPSSTIQWGGRRRLWEPVLSGWAWALW